MPECFATYYSPEERKEIQLNMAEWQKAGLDRHSIFADPGFKDAANFDFTLKEDSILWDYGFNETVKVDE